MKYKYAIQHKVSGQLVDYCYTLEQAAYWLSEKNLEAVDIEHSSRVEVIYTELGGPHGYGHQEPSFTTYGALLPCVRKLYRWLQSEARFWGPDPRDVRDYLRHCALYINGEDRTYWLLRQVDKITIKTIFG